VPESCQNDAGVWGPNDMQGLIALALNAAALVGILYQSLSSQPWVFAAGTGHAGLECVACHHVHAPIGVRGRWESPVEEVPRFGFYPFGLFDLDDTSKLCLSCHDGAIAPAVPMPHYPLIVSQIGLSVSATGDGFRFPMGDHPVGVRYDSANPRLARQPGLQADVQIPLPEGRVQCVSCHDPHGTAGHEYLLRVSNRRSGLCLSCHRI
jgi:predicted CXXCH cytochrome family protein